MSFPFYIVDFVSIFTSHFDTLVILVDVTAFYTCIMLNVFSINMGFSVQYGEKIKKTNDDDDEINYCFMLIYSSNTAYSK